MAIYGTLTDAAHEGITAIAAVAANQLFNGIPSTASKSEVELFLSSIDDFRIDFTASYFTDELYAHGLNVLEFLEELDGLLFIDGIKLGDVNRLNNLVRLDELELTVMFDDSTTVSGLTNLLEVRNITIDFNDVAAGYNPNTATTVTPIDTGLTIPKDIYVNDEIFDSDRYGDAFDYIFSNYSAFTGLTVTNFLSSLATVTGTLEVIQTRLSLLYRARVFDQREVSSESRVRDFVLFANVLRNLNFPNLTTAQSVQVEGANYLYNKQTLSFPNLTSSTRGLDLEYTNIDLPNLTEIGPLNLNTSLVASNLNIPRLTSISGSGDIIIQAREITAGSLTTINGSRVVLYYDAGYNLLETINGFNIGAPKATVSFNSIVIDDLSLMSRDLGNLSITGSFVLSDDFWDDGYNALGCFPNWGPQRTWLENRNPHDFYLTLWDEAYPDGRTDCDTPTPTPTPADNTPDAFNFDDFTNQALSSTVESNAVTLAGFDGSLLIRLIGGEDTKIRVNGGEFSSTGQMVSAGDTIQIQTTTPDTFGRTIAIFVGVGNTSAFWRISTSANIGPYVVNPISDLKQEVEDSFDIDISNVFMDPDHPDLTFELLGAPPSLKVTSDNHIAGTLTLNDLGTWNVVLQAIDDEGAKGRDEFVIEVDINRDDIKQVITEIDAIETREEETETELQALRSKLDTLCDTVAAEVEKLGRLETVVAQNVEALVDIPLDGEDMVYWLTKFTQQENSLYQLAPSDYPLFIDKRTISVDPTTRRSIAEGRALVNGTPEDGVRITLSNSPRLATGTLMTTTTSDNGFYSFDFQSLPNTTYYISASHGVNFYQVAIAYQGTSS